MADKDYTPSETAMEAARRINLAASGDDDLLSEYWLARIIDEAYAPLLKSIERGCFTVNGRERLIRRLIRRATPREKQDGK